MLAELLEQFGNGPMTPETINAATSALEKELIKRRWAASEPLSGY